MILRHPTKQKIRTLDGPLPSESSDKKRPKKRTLTSRLPCEGMLVFFRTRALPCTPLSPMSLTALPADLWQELL